MGVGIRSLELVITGKVDVVEFHLSADPVSGCTLPSKQGRWASYPIEYKRGWPRRGVGDDIQVCAQALCHEEMLQCAVLAGAIY
uniref:RecB family exonuclease N n=1 Tax=Solibacter usitatus (strain Ellin6076) TaxID=234267 RepID=Q020K8_SOLUE